MTVSRRRFLRNSAFTVAACTVQPLYAWTGNKPPVDGSAFTHTPSAHVVTRQAWERLVGADFEVTPASGKGSPVWLRLLAVDDLPALEPVNTGMMAVKPKPPTTVVSTTGFMVSFSGGSGPLSQGSYLFEHESLGKFELFIVPGAPGLDTYTAVFNRLIGSTPVHVPVRQPNAPAGRGRGSSVAPTGSSVAPSESGSNPSGGRPLQQQVEPGLRDRFEPQLPE